VFIDPCSRRCIHEQHYKSQFAVCKNCELVGGFNSYPSLPTPPLSIMIHHCSSQCLCSLIIRTANYEWVSFGDWCLDQDMSALMTALIDSILDVVSAQSTWPMLVRSPDDIGHQWAQIAILKNQPFFLRRRSLGQHPYFLFFESVQRQADFPHLGLPLVGW
jgi:hypothetical protein